MFAVAVVWFLIGSLAFHHWLLYHYYCCRCYVVAVFALFMFVSAANWNGNGAIMPYFNTNMRCFYFRFTLIYNETPILPCDTNCPSFWTIITNADCCRCIYHILCDYSSYQCCLPSFPTLFILHCRLRFPLASCFVALDWPVIDPNFSFVSLIVIISYIEGWIPFVIPSMLQLTATPIASLLWATTE